MDLQEFISLDLPPILTAVFSAATCALLGNYLVLRRLSLMGDAISHSVLPGIVLAFLITYSRGEWVVFLGAAIAAILCAVLIEIIREFGKLESGAAMGVVFSLFFASGVLLIEQASARSVDLDAECLLHGQLESIFWNPSFDKSFFTFATFSQLPSEVITSLVIFLVSVIFVLLLYKELKISSFDPALSTALGFNSRILHHILMVIVAAAVVASFKAVGSILVISMLICPAASARLLTDKLKTQLILSLLIAVVISVFGYLLGAFGPLWMGFENSVNAAGMMAVLGGILLILSMIFSPSYGLIAKGVKRINLDIRVRGDDILAILYRELESKIDINFTKQEIYKTFSTSLTTRLALHKLTTLGLVVLQNQKLILTDIGKIKAKDLVRSHRLWEAYLVNRVGLSPDHVHESAHQLEHFTSDLLQNEIAKTEGDPKIDPHGKNIPE